MKLFHLALPLLAVLCGSSAFAKTTLIDFGGSSYSFSTPWNQDPGKNPTLSSDRTTNTLKYTDSTNSSVSVTYKAGSALLVGPPTANSSLTNLTAQQAFGTAGLNLWQAAHGSALTDSRIQNGWSESALLGVGNLVDPGNIQVGGFQKSASYTLSAVFTVSGLANIASLKVAPITLGGSNFTVSHAYLCGSGGQILDLSVLNNVELASLLSTGTFMMTWQLQTSSSFDPASKIDMEYSNSLLSLGGNYGISAMAVTDGTPSLPVPSLPVPEPSSALLGAFGLAGLMLTRRRK